MGESMFDENADYFMFDSYPKKKQFQRSFAKSACMNQDFFNTNFFNIHAELDYFDEILEKHYDNPARTKIETKDYSTLNENLSLDFKVNMIDPQLNCREVSCQLLQTLQERRVNLVLVATSLEENDVVQKLKGSLDPETSSMIPLSFDENINDEVHDKQHSFELPSLRRENNTNYRRNSKGPDKNAKQLCSKKTTLQRKDEKYWKRRSSNNEAAKRSREAKRARFTWIENRTKELEVENAILQKELQSLEQKVLAKEKKSNL